MKKTILLLFVFIGSFHLSIAQWQPIPSNTTSILVDICFVNDSTGFIISYTGEVLKTTDGGNNWSICATLNGLVRSICHVGNDTIYVAGNGIYRSCDCGATWQLFIPNPGYSIGYLHYFPSSKGIFTKYEYENCNEGAFSASVARDYLGYVFNADSSLQISSVGGGYLSPLIIINDSICYAYTHTQFIIPYHCTTSSLQQPSLLKSNDQGQNWTSVFQFSSGPFYHSFINKDTGFFVNENSLYKTVDGGININQVGTFSYIYSLHEAMFISDSVGYVIGSAKIYKISTTVLHNTLEYSGSYELNKIYKTNNGNVFVVGFSGIILKRNPNIITNAPSYQDQFFAISPNPATSQITITNNNFSSSDKTTISIFNLSGEQMMFDTFHGKEQAEMDVSTLSKGLYLVKIQNTAGVVCKKLVIE